MFAMFCGLHSPATARSRPSSAGRRAALAGRQRFFAIMCSVLAICCGPKSSIVCSARCSSVSNECSTTPRGIPARGACSSFRNAVATLTWLNAAACSSIKEQTSRVDSHAAICWFSWMLYRAAPCPPPPRPACPPPCPPRPRPLPPLPSPPPLAAGAAPSAAWCAGARPAAASPSRAGSWRNEHAAPATAPGTHRMLTRCQELTESMRVHRTILQPRPGRGSSCQSGSEARLAAA